MRTKKVMQTATANPHHTNTTSNITRWLALCKVVSETKVFENFVEPLLVGGLLLVCAFYPLIIHIIRMV